MVSAANLRRASICAPETMARHLGRISEPAHAGANKAQRTPTGKHTIATPIGVRMRRRRESGRHRVDATVGGGLSWHRNRCRLLFTRTATAWLFADRTRVLRPVARPRCFIRTACYGPFGVSSCRLSAWKARTPVHTGGMPQWECRATPCRRAREMPFETATGRFQSRQPVLKPGTVDRVPTAFSRALLLYLLLPCIRRYLRVCARMTSDGVHSTRRMLQPCRPRARRAWPD